jgi:hypothetical protein
MRFRKTIQLGDRHGRFALPLTKATRQPSRYRLFMALFVCATILWAAIWVIIFEFFAH